MRALTAADILHVWEDGQRSHPIDRALRLLGAASPDLTWEALARLPVGQRDARLLMLRAQTIDPTLRGFAECPACSERLEFELDSGQFLPPPGSPPASGELETEIAGVTLHCRLPDSADMAAAAACADVPLARRTLFERCVIHAHRDGAPLPVESLPAEVENGLSELLAQVDPQANLQLQMNCPACAHAWEITLDPGEFFWVELNSLARCILDDVHTLASVYGWREADILGMSAVRRQAYLDKALEAANSMRGKPA